MIRSATSAPTGQRRGHKTRNSPRLKPHDEPRKPQVCLPKKATVHLPSQSHTVPGTVCSSLRSARHPSSRPVDAEPRLVMWNSHPCLPLVRRSL
ncbi:unnamed protein product [Lota lota]